MSTQQFRQRTANAAKWISQRLLGLFIVWQLFYMTIANSLETLEIVTHRMPETSEKLGEAIQECRDGNQGIDIPGVSPLIYAIDKYGQVTEQPQRWSLFAPNISNQSTFLTLELHFNGVDESVWLFSENEPKDVTSFVRLGGNRFRSVEQNLEIRFFFGLDESEEDARKRWRTQIQERLARDSDILQAWITLRVEKFLMENPQAPEPSEIVVHIRGYDIPTPDSPQNKRSDDPYQMTIARWIPHLEYPEHVLPIEAFDPVTDQFVLQNLETE